MNLCALRDKDKSRKRKKHRETRGELSKVKRKSGLRITAIPPPPSFFLSPFHSLLSFYCKVIYLHLGVAVKMRTEKREKKAVFDLVWQGHEASSKVVKEMQQREMKNGKGSEEMEVIFTCNYPLTRQIILEHEM